jgi:carboxylesterase type B
MVCSSCFTFHITPLRTTSADGNHLVKRSIELGQPIVVVSIAYRHNFFGFLTSKELLDDQKARGETPILNQGLNDQRIALQWIQRYIHLFGGDPKRVTLSGESAGAHSVWSQIKGRATNLFSRAIIRSFPPARSSSFEDAQKRFDDIVVKQMRQGVKR